MVIHQINFFQLTQEQGLKVTNLLRFLLPSNNAERDIIRHCWATILPSLLTNNLPSLLGEARQSITDSRDKLGNDETKTSLLSDGYSRHCWAKPGNLLCHLGRVMCFRMRSDKGWVCQVEV